VLDVLLFSGRSILEVGRETDMCQPTGLMLDFMSCFLAFLADSQLRFDEISYPVCQPLALYVKTSGNDRENDRHLADETFVTKGSQKGR
jgi:hypothetical protein